MIITIINLNRTSNHIEIYIIKYVYVCILKKRKRHYPLIKIGGSIREIILRAFCFPLCVHPIITWYAFLIMIIIVITHSGIKSWYNFRSFTMCGNVIMSAVYSIVSYHVDTCCHCFNAFLWLKFLYTLADTL